MFDEEILKLLGKINIFEKAFDNIRIVDPEKNINLDLYGDKVKDTELSCFKFWGTNKACDNCVSIHAYQNNSTYVKIEYTDAEIYIVTAIPIELPDRIVVVELLKNVTHSLVFNTNEKDMRTNMNMMIDNMNSIAFKDALTGIYNRRYLNEKLPINLMNANMADYSISIIMADIDFFKKVNDTYGHLAGDATLKKFASILAKALKRESDWVARYGGEEFVICLPGANNSFALKMAEKIRKKVEESTIIYKEYKIKITSSFGICTLTPPHNATIEEFIDGADKKLYEAKHNGRNRVEA
ncbi:MAG: GGDEF domain-containing protein [Mobilitalea sp.]